MRHSDSKKEEDIFPERQDVKVPEFNPINEVPFTIDFIHRKIIPQPGVNIGGTGRKFLKMRPEFFVSGVVYATSASTDVAGGAGETETATYTIPGNTLSLNNSNFDSAGNGWRFWASGTFTTAANGDDATIRVKLGGTTIHTMSFTGSIVSSVPWHLTWTSLIATIGSTGTFTSYLEGDMSTTNKNIANTGTSAINTTIDRTLSITAQVPTNSSRIIRTRQVIIEILN